MSEPETREAPCRSSATVGKRGDALPADEGTLWALDASDGPGATAVPQTEPNVGTTPSEALGPSEALSGHPGSGLRALQLGWAGEAWLADRLRAAGFRMRHYGPYDPWDLGYEVWPTVVPIGVKTSARQQARLLRRWDEVAWARLYILVTPAVFSSPEPFRVAGWCSGATCRDQGYWDVRLPVHAWALDRAWLEEGDLLAWLAAFNPATYPVTPRTPYPPV